MYIIFIGLNLGWGTIATAVVESNEDDVINNPNDLAYQDGICFDSNEPLENVGEPVCQLAQGCPDFGEIFDPAQHHKGCAIGIQFPDALLYDADPQSPDDTSLGGGLMTRTVTCDRPVTTAGKCEGNLIDVLVADSNGTAIDSGEVQSKNFFDDIFDGATGLYSFVTDVVTAGQFAATIIFQTFTGGFILDVLGTGFVGVEFPKEFIVGFKVLLGMASVSWFYFLYKGVEIF